MSAPRTQIAVADVRAGQVVKIRRHAHSRQVWTFEVTKVIGVQGNTAIFQGRRVTRDRRMGPGHTVWGRKHVRSFDARQTVAVVDPDRPFDNWSKP